MVQLKAPVNKVERGHEDKGNKKERNEMRESEKGEKMNTVL